mmetsp:Transcript_11010/g.12581  ORF Transcript_11010/g.12581 Transcript_11010/m.12581 type:complete len:421 (+) Transcript_11010:439-1701(+)
MLTAKQSDHNNSTLFHEQTDVEKQESQSKKIASITRFDSQASTTAILQDESKHDSTTYEDDRAPWLVRHVPPGINGLSLGLIGLGSIFFEFEYEIQHDTFNINYIIQILAWCSVCLGGTIFFFFCMRIVIHPQFALLELKVPVSISAYGAWHVVYLFVCARLIHERFRAYSAASILWYIGAILQVILISVFFHACWKTKTYPEPFWNPPTINCAVVAIAGCLIGASPTHWLVLGSFIYALVLQILLVPPQVYRVLRRSEPDKQVAPSASVGMMQAPASLNALTFGVMRRSGFSSSLDDELTDVLFILSTFVLLCTLYATWVRRKKIYTKGFGLDWVAFTFPTSSSAVAALQYTSPVDSDPAAGDLGSNWNKVVRIYALILSVATIFLIMGIASRLFFRLAKNTSEIIMNSRLVGCFSRSK